MTDILEFQGEYRWLSNFWPVSVTLDGVVFPSVEHAYQAAKVVPAERYKFLQGTAGNAKRAGRGAAVRKDWDDVKIEVMRALISQKFATGTSLGDKLLATQDANLIEGNRWGDTFWGVCRGVGQNWLGRLLMEQRSILQATPR